MPADLFSLLEKEDKPERISQTRKSSAAKENMKEDDSDALKKKKKGFAGLGDVLAKYELKDKGGYITKEFQDFGIQLAVKLNDMSHKSLYIRMAKSVDRIILERALSFVSDANTAKSKARLFMWKVKQLKEEKKQRDKAKNEKTV